MIDRLALARGVDLARPVQFKFDNRVYCGYTVILLPALLGNGIRRGRSIVQIPPTEGYLLRWIGRAQCVGCSREGHPEPNTRATEVELYEGLQAWSQNAWPSSALMFSHQRSLVQISDGRLLLQDFHVARSVLGGSV